MTCSHCGASIADKALICYKCGAQTVAPKHQAAAAPARRRLAWPLAALGAAAVLLALAWWAGLFGG